MFSGQYEWEVYNLALIDALVNASLTSALTRQGSALFANSIA